MSQELIVQTPSPEALVDQALLTCESQGTRRVYRIYLLQFLKSKLPLSREGVALHLEQQREAGKSAGSRLGSLAAIKKLAKEAQVRGLILYQDLLAIQDLKGGRPYRAKAGLWLTVAQVQVLLSLPDRSSYWGTRDAALIALLVGCGLRRAELAALPWSCYQSREGRMCLVDLLGKGGRTRTVPVPLWADPYVAAWMDISQGERPVPVTNVEKAWDAVRSWNWDKSLVAGGISEDSIEYLVAKYGEQMNLRLRPHDLRRTLAQMMRKAGAPLEQIRDQLGHQSVQTTQIYLGLGIELEPGKAGVDLIQIPVPLHRRVDPPVLLEGPPPPPREKKPSFKTLCVKGRKAHAG